MRKQNNTGLILVWIICMAFIACNQSTKKEEPVKTDTGTTTTMTEPEPMPGFDASMDATKMAGYPAKILADSLGLKLYEFEAKPGDSIPMHAHPDHAMYVVQGGKADLTGKDGKTQSLELKTGQGIIFGPEMHSARNTGNTTIKLAIVHVYRPRS